MDKPIYVGFAILELSKVLMYEKHNMIIYNHILERKKLHCLYMDSVTKDTPIILKLYGNYKMLRVYENFNEEDWYQDDGIITQCGYKELGDCDIIKVWSSDSWKNIKRAVRHKTDKDVYRIRTKPGLVDVTRDHSSLDQNREIIKPCCLILGEEIIHNDLEFVLMEKNIKKNV